MAELRRERNMRQEELAAAAGISRQSIIAIERDASTRRWGGYPHRPVLRCAGGGGVLPRADGWRCRPETGEGG